jgi:hypothetical protein
MWIVYSLHESHGAKIDSRSDLYGVRTKQCTSTVDVLKKNRIYASVSEIPKESSAEEPVRATSQHPRHNSRAINSSHLISILGREDDGSLNSTYLKEIIKTRTKATGTRISL